MDKPDEHNAPAAPERKGPYLSAALIAERVLVEQDQTQTFVRVIDKCSIPAEVIRNRKNDELDFTPLTVALVFKAGGYQGKSHVLVVQGGPSGNSKPLGLVEVPFDGTLGRSFSVLIPVAVTWEGNGFYWFDIQLDNKFVTRIPFEVNVATEALEKGE